MVVDTAVFERIPPPAFGKENEMGRSGQHSPNVGAGFFWCGFRQKNRVLEQWSVEPSPFWISDLKEFIVVIF